MAARSGSGTGTIVTVVILAVLSLGLFVMTIVFWSQKNRERQALDTLKVEMAEFAPEAERRRDDIGQVRAAAKAEGKSALGYLSESMQKSMQLVTGSPRDTVKQLETKIASAAGETSGSLLGVLSQRDQEIQNLRAGLAAAEAARDRALADRENEVRRVTGIETSSRESLEALNADVNRYKDQVDQYRDEMNLAKAARDAEVEKARAATREVETALNTDITELQQQLVLAQETSKRLQEQMRGQSFKAGDEYALVDGEVIGLDSAENTVFVNIGRAQKAVLGMSFEIYSEPTAIRPDAQSGDYPAGKAAIELIRVDENSAVGRIVREKRGNPVVKGDVVANAVYDPKKSYKMLVYGNFDSNVDGVATMAEQSDIVAMIESWGGEVVTELTGQVDFLVLGQRPVLRPQPPSTSPVPVIDEYMRQRRVVQEYDRLFEQATATSIPVLTENRLRTLIGASGGR
ncbi:MAG: hypothetical protein H7Y88_04735 [Phycisphaerales bacterium]|nr:hypothetical protein [Phycisphaerales bacterium]